MITAALDYMEAGDVLLFAGGDHLSLERDLATLMDKQGWERLPC